MKNYTTGRIMAANLKRGFSTRIKYLSFPVLLFIFSTTSISYSSFYDEDLEKRRDFFKPVIDSLLAQGADANILNQMVTHNNTTINEDYTKLSVSTRKSKPNAKPSKPGPNKKYAHNYNALSVKRSKAFLAKNLSILKKCEKKYGVPKEVITSVLWVETRHGAYLGNHHVISVYLGLAMADQPYYIKRNLDALKEKYKGPERDWPYFRDKLKARCKSKAKWAREQLMALVKMHKISPISIFEIKGSYAGAFGMSQFIPSSYISWAVDGDGDGKINIFEKEDAIFSVGNYLKINGWGKTRKSHEEAVYHYNHSSAYVYAVLKLAELIK